MSTQRNLRYRAARDELIDLLGIGETYPLRDMPVETGRLLVPFAQAGQIRLAQSQSQVGYRLSEDEAGREVAGTGEALLVPTPPIREDIIFTIRARKLHTGREADLTATVTFIVGLDTTTDAWIRPHDAAEPRLLPYGSVIEVEIDQSQEGVDYQLVHFPNGPPGNAGDLGRDVNLSQERDGKTSMPGTGPEAENIVLGSIRLREDVEVRIRAVRSFDPAEGRPPETTLLDIVMPVHVRPDDAITAVARPGAILDQGGAGSIALAGTQVSATYRAHARALIDAPDGDYRFGAADESLITVPVPGEPDVRIAVPEPASSWDSPPGFAPASQVAAGSGGDLALTLTGLPGGKVAADTMVVVEARKRHKAADGSTFETAVRLRTATVFLVRPDLAVPLKLAVTALGGQTTGTLAVRDGQPGVFYSFAVQPGGARVAQTAYFHKRDARDGDLNKGLGQIGVGRDFVVPRDQPVPPLLPPDRQRPAEPFVTTGPIDAQAKLSVRATMALTRVSIDLGQRKPDIVPPA